MSAQTRWHKHWHVKVRYNSRLYRLLKIVLWRSTDEDYVRRSRLVWGQPDTRDDAYTLTVLGLLHTLTGLTLRLR